MKVAIIGSRQAYNLDSEIVIKYIPIECDEIVSGGSGAVDLLAEKIAINKNIIFKCFPPQYSLYGKKAPLIRNIQIIEYSDLVLAFWDKVSHGTKHVINESLKRDIPIKIINI